MRRRADEAEHHADQQLDQRHAARRRRAARVIRATSTRVASVTRSAGRPGLDAHRERDDRAVALRRRSRT